MGGRRGKKPGKMNSWKWMEGMKEETGGEEEVEEMKGGRGETGEEEGEGRGGSRGEEE